MMEKPTRPKKPDFTKRQKPARLKHVEYFVLEYVDGTKEVALCKGYDEYYMPIFDDHYFEDWLDATDQREFYEEEDPEYQESWQNDFWYDHLNSSAPKMATFELVANKTGVDAYALEARPVRNIDGYVMFYSYNADVRLSDEEYAEALAAWEAENKKLDALKAAYEDEVAQYKVDKARYDLAQAQAKLDKAQEEAT